MTDKPLSEPSSTWKQVLSQSLQRQLNWRFLIVFLGVTVLGSLMLLLGYRSVLEVSDRTAANDTAAHIQKII